MAEHPITPPPELVQQWASESLATQHLCTQAARWGADQELEACLIKVEQMFCWGSARDLRATRRPKPPSLKEKALHILDTHGPLTPAEADTIRRALEALPE